MKLLKTKRLWLLHAQLRGHPMSQSHGLLTMKKFKIKLTNWMLSQKWDMSKELIAWRVDASSGFVANTLGLVDHYKPIRCVWFTTKKSLILSHKDDGKKVRCEIHNPAIDQDGNYKVNWTREFTLKVLVKFLFGNGIILL